MQPCQSQSGWLWGLSRFLTSMWHQRIMSIPIWILRYMVSDPTSSFLMLKVPFVRPAF